MASNYTEHYGLCQWEATDQVLREEFNQDNAKVDEALQELHDKGNALEQQVSKCGNCTIYTTNYTGNGTYGQENANSITFPSKPLLVFVGSTGEDGRVLYALNGMTKTYAQASGYSLITLSWSGNKLAWSNHLGASSQLNNSGTTYLVMALLEAGI